VNRTKVPPADIVIMAGGAVMLIGSFLNFYTLAGYSASAWSGANGLGVFGIGTVAVLCGIVMAAQVALATFASGTTIPDRLLGLTWDQLHLALASQAALLMLSFLIRSKSPFSFGIGFWLMLLSAIALLVGAIMRVTGAGSTPNTAG
jgi:hypothetical protein